MGTKRLRHVFIGAADKFDAQWSSYQDVLGLGLHLRDDDHDAIRELGGHGRGALRRDPAGAAFAALQK